MPTILALFADILLLIHVVAGEAEQGDQRGRILMCPEMASERKVETVRNHTVAAKAGQRSKKAVVFAVEEELVERQTVVEGVEDEAVADRSFAHTGCWSCCWV